MRILRLARVLLFLSLVARAPLEPCRAQEPSRWSGSSGRPLIIDFLDVGQGDSILIRSPEGKTALIDAGPSRDAAYQALRRKRIESLDMVIVTHHHSDHYGGMDQVIRNLKPRYFLATNSPHTTKMYLKLLQTVRDEGITSVQPTARPRRIELGSVVMTILPQPPETPDEENNNSIGIRLEYGGFVVIMTGDSEDDERKWWMSHNPDLLKDCTILKLAHHGSRNGTDQRWLDLLQPEVAVASLATGNSYGHPHSETVSLLRRNQVPLLRTDQRGTITIVSDGQTWNLVNPQLARRRQPRGGEEAVAVGSDDEGSRSSRTSSSRTRSRRR